METTIPFSGFYESVHSSNLDEAFRQYFADDHDEVNEALFDTASMKVNFHLAFIEYAKEYTKAFADKLGLTTLAFKELDSPKYYNFETDRIFCTIDLSEVKEIFDKVDKEKLDKAIHENFTSRDGFHSFYKNSLDQWPIFLHEWNINQVGTLLETLFETKDQYKEHELFDYANEVAMRCIDKVITPEISALIEQADEWGEKQDA